MSRYSRALAIAWLAALAGLLASPTTAADKPIKVFILAGQSNMEGTGFIKSEPQRNGGKGSLEFLAQDAATADKFGRLRASDGAWKVRDDVWIHYLERKGRLTAGFGASADRIGPELGFGQVVGDAYDEPVLLVKLAWGGKSLAQDFRPPSSGGQLGPYYREIVDRTKAVLADLKNQFPELGDRAATIAGFGWHQGWNDRVNQAFNDEYERNMANFIRDIRRDLGVPQLPFVIAETGMSGPEEKHPRALSLMKAQAAVAEYDEFRGNVAFVGTKRFWRDKDVSPSGQAYHWNTNAETYYLIGEAMGEAMLKLCAAPASDAAAEVREKYTENPGPDGNGNHIVGPEYRLDPDLTDRGNPAGKQFQFTMRLADSKLFPGTDTTLDPKKPVRKERKIFVYVPAAYKDGTKAPILVMMDGPSNLNLVRFALDNLTVSKDPNRKLPPFVVISVENGGDDGKGSERGLEYDTLSDRYARFIYEEVLPAVLSNAEIKSAYPGLAFTDNPWGRAAMGCSSGGAAVLTMGWFRPDLFRRLITYSGTFVDQQDDDAPEEAKYPLGAWEYHSSLKLIESTPKKPLRIFTHVAENDLRAKDPEETYHNWVMANERTAASLKAKEYDYRYVFSRASRHCDRSVFEHTLADTLVWMWRGYHD